MAERGGITRPVRQEDAVGSTREHLARWRRRRDDLDGGDPRELGEDRPLHAEVVGDDPQGPARDPVGRGRGHLGDEVLALGAGFGDGRREQLGPLGGPEGARHRARLAHVPRQPPSVDTGEPADAVPAQERLELPAPRQLLGRSVRSRSTTPRQNGRGASSSAAVTP